MWMRLCAVLLVAYVDRVVGGPWKWSEVRWARALWMVVSTWVTGTAPLQAWLVLTLVHLLLWRRLPPREVWILALWALVESGRRDGA